MDLIGKGGYAEVFKGVCKNQLCAIKKIKLVPDEEKLIRREIANLWNLRKYKQENIIELINIVRENDDLYLILEYMDGGSLHNYLHDEKYYLIFTAGTQRFKELIKLLCQAAKGLAFLHEKNIAHRDVKPQNLLLDGSKRKLKLCDFGFSKQLATVNTKDVGTSEYKAPEVLHGNIYTTQCDVFSLAITIWETLTQKIPHYGYKKVALMREVCDGKRPDLNELDCIEIKTLLDKCWDGEPASRPTMEEVQLALLRIHDLY